MTEKRIPTDKRGFAPMKKPISPKVAKGFVPVSSPKKPGKSTGKTSAK